MLKWAVPNQRKPTGCDCRTPVADSDQDTCSNLSSDSSDSSLDLAVPIRYHERRASRPKSLALVPHDAVALDADKFGQAAVSRKSATHRTASSPLYASCSRANRHSMFILPPPDGQEPGHKSHTLDSLRHAPAKLSVYQPPPGLRSASLTPDIESQAGILKITTDKAKSSSSRNSFWKSLRDRAQGKSKDKKISKAHSMTNLPINQTLTPTDVYTDSPAPVAAADYNRSLPIPVPGAEHDASPSYKSKSNILRRRSFKLIKKENENRRPKLFSRAAPDYGADDMASGSPDSGVSSMRLNSNDTDVSDSPASPITPIDTQPEDLSCLKQQFTEAVLQYLSERLDKKGYSSTVCVSRSARSSSSDSTGSSDVFCYDTDTILRRPHHHHSNGTNNTTQAIKATF